MASFVYAPAVRVRIESSDTNINIVDVSRDISQMSLTRRANAVSTVSFTLNNTQRKYDRAFKPGDKITIEMKRITWVRVFTGTMNEVPVFTIWPKTVELSASCTLKKLQMFYWDPTTSEAQKVVSDFFTGNQANVQGNVSDSGASVLITELLNRVTNWNRNKIHIGQIPSNWFDFAKDLNALITGAESMQSVLGNGSLQGGTFNGSIPLAPGTYGGIPLDATQVKNIAAMYGTVRGRGLNDKAAILCLMTGMVESQFRILANTKNAESEANPNKQGEGSDGSSVGIYQQQDNWGTVSQRMDVSNSTILFLNVMVKVPNWQTRDDYGTICQTVQVSAFPFRYDGYRKFAEAVIGLLSVEYKNALTDAFNDPSSATLGAADASDVPAGVIPSSTSNQTHTGTEFASVASNLITRSAPGHIRYHGANQGYDDDPPESQDPTKLDCSSLVDWVYYHTFGSKWISPRGTAATQAAKCQKIPVSLAARVQGALLFLGSNGGEHHVAISLGNGKVVEASSDDNPPTKQVSIDDLYPFDSAGLVPGLSYKNAATDQAAATELSKYVGPTGVSNTVAGADGTVLPSGQAPSSPLEALIQLLSYTGVVNGDTLGGARALANDQPILPYLLNLSNSSMRSVSSAPNGDFIAWFPDYFGIWGTAAKMNIQLIELQDFDVRWSDQKIVTHQYVAGATQPFFESSSGGIIEGGDNSYSGFNAALQTSGVVTMDYPQIFQAIFGKAADKSFTSEYMKRFGGRPSFVQMPNIGRGKQEFFMALWLFMQAWANQFTANVPLTFMPELFPGMLLCIPEYGFQAYVEEVTHRISFGPNGGFYTDVSISAPARTSNKTDVFGLLPLGGPRS